MLKAFLINLLLSRGISAGAEFLGKLIRHGLTTLGGALAVYGLEVSGEEMTTLMGAASVVAGLVMSAVRIFASKYA